MSEATETRRERAQQATRAEIKATARQQMAQGDANALSLRAIATAMGLTAPALYRYYPSRDELITALIIDAFHALGDALEEARRACPPTAYAAQFTAMMQTYRSWALAHKADFTLIYGTPIPGYHAPNDVTDPAVRRSTAPLVALLIAAWEAGALRPDVAYAAAPTPLADRFGVILPEAERGRLPALALHVGFVAWTRLQGLIMLELFGHIAPIVGPPAAFYDFEVRMQLRLLGLAPLR